MVKKFFSIFYKEIDGLHEAAYLLAFFAFLSQVLALLRDRVLATSFGVGHTLDIYYSSFEIPDFIFATVGSIVSISVLVPFITERLTRSNYEAKHFINTIFSFFSLLIVFASMLGFIFMPFLAPHIFPGIADKSVLIHMARILLLSPIFLGISNFLASITQVGKRFLVYALSPLVYNLGIIFGALFFYPIFGIYGLAYGVILGTIMHLSIQLPFVFKSGLFKAWPFHFDWSLIKNVFLISIPRTITLAMTQITMLALVGMASVMTAGSISIFNFSNNLESVPLSIIGMSYSLAAFPTLSALHHDESEGPIPLAYLCCAPPHDILVHTDQRHIHRASRADRPCHLWRGEVWLEWHQAHRRRACDLRPFDLGPVARPDLYPRILCDGEHEEIALRQPHYRRVLDRTFVCLCQDILQHFLFPIFH